MAYEISDPADDFETWDAESEEHDPGRPTGMPPCDGSEPEPDDCDPGGEIYQRERELAAAQADVENRNKALEDLKAKSDLLQKAKTDYAGKAEERDERRKACEEFVDCKKPDLSHEDCRCVEKALDDYDEALQRYRRYIRHCIWPIGRARIRTSRAEHHFERAEERYEWVRNQATECLATCGDLRTKYDEAVEAREWCLAYLYWRLAQKELEAAQGGGLDPDKYHDRLCRAFENFCRATDILNEARASQDDLEREKAAVEAEYEALKSNRLTVLTDQVSKCCCQPEPDGPKSYESAGGAPVQGEG